MSQRARSMVQLLLWLVITVAVAGSVAAGAIEPWPVAAEKLGAIGPGPYVPLSYSYRSTSTPTGTRTYRSQTYFVVSQIGKSLSTYRVVEEDNIAKVEEQRYGFLYGVVFFLVFLGGAVGGLRSLKSR